MPIRKKRKLRISRNWITALSLSILTFSIVFFISRFHQSNVSASAPTNGRIFEKNGQRILQVSGTHYEMGYAQGYLIGDDIILMIQKYLIEYLLGNNANNWNTALTRVQNNMQFGRYASEIQGIYDGMAASGMNMYVSGLGRNITVGDLKVWNSMFDIGLILPVCSSFSAWGTATPNGEVLQGRNMDFPYDTQNGYAASKKMIIAYQPTGGQQYMVVTWPGFIGPGTGMNQSQLALTVNVSNGPTDSTYVRTDTVPVGITLREILEDTSGSGDLFPQVWSKFTSQPRTRSVNVQVSQPRGRGADVSVIAEIDSNGQEIRHAAPSKSYLYSTNHFIQRSGGVNPGTNSYNRYSTLTSDLQSYTTTNDMKISSTDAQQILRDVATSWPTLLSIYMKPETLTFDLSFASVTGFNPVSITQAPFNPPVSYTWAELFATASPTPIPTLPPTPVITPTPTVAPTPIPTVPPTSTPVPTPVPTVVPTPTPTPGSTTQTISVRVNTSSDDATEDGTSFSTTASPLWIGNASSATASYTGLRFNGINIPKNATIVSAQLKVTAAQTAWLTMKFSFAAQAIGNSPTFSSGSKPSQRTQTAAKVNHNSNVSWTANTVYTLDQINTIIQEVVKRSDWQSGNSISLILKGTGGAWGRKFIAGYEGSPAAAPLLEITYK